MYIVRRALCSALAFVSLAAPAFAMSGDGCGGECASCHALTVKEANGILRELGRVTMVKPALVRGLFEITVEKDGKTAVAYLDYGKKHLIAGQIFDLASGKAGAATGQQQPSRIDPASLPTEHALVMGNPKGKKRLFVFTDPQCPYCQKMHLELKKLVKMAPEVAVFVMLNPLPMHPGSYDIARSLLESKDRSLLDRAFQGEAVAKPLTEGSRTSLDGLMRLARERGLASTPTLVLPDGKVMVGMQDAKSLKKMLEQK